MKVVNKFFELFGEFMIVALTGLSIATVVVAGCLKALDDLDRSTEIERLERRVSELERGAGMSARDFISPTAGRAGSAETAQAKDAAVRPEVKR